jgi:hypothetical protein
MTGDGLGSAGSSTHTQQSRLRREPAWAVSSISTGSTGFYNMQAD